MAEPRWTDEPTVAMSVRACRSITLSRAANFAYGLRLSPEPKRSALYALYAWTRRADDIADSDDPMHDRARALAEYRARTERVLGGAESPSDHADGGIWPAVAGAVRAHRLEPGLFGELLDGMEQDLGAVAIADEDAFDGYCYRVASTVGLLCVGIWGLKPGADPSEARRLASMRGRAFQRTNVLRDFAEDYDSEPRRVYVPASAFEAAGLTTEALRTWAEPERCEAFVTQRIDLARAAFRESASLDGMVSADGRAVLRAMTGIYAALLERLARRPACVGLGPRVRVPKRTKVWIAARALVSRRPASAAR
ncbi:MAG: phytoene/squalene synthase family protein [Planctomycetota bacterium]